MLCCVPLPVDAAGVAEDAQTGQQGHHEGEQEARPPGPYPQGALNRQATDQSEVNVMMLTNQNTALPVVNEVSVEAE